MAEKPWYIDAVIYEVHVRSFFDSDGDGIGDLIGLAERLDYIEEMGVTALWLLPFYPSPLKDDGYDIAGYTDIHPDYGTLADFQHFLDEAHRRGLKVISELVINHTSDQHPWFQRARQAPPGSTERDFYVWSDTPDKYSEARVIFPEAKDSNWTYDPMADQYYWHRFYAHQPDLNFDNPAVRRKIFEIVDFWLEMGIDGLRLDAVTYLYQREGTNCESLPETHAFLRSLRNHIDDRYDDRMLLAEANQWPEDAIDYFGDGDECHMTFHFPLMPRLYMSVEMEDRQPIVDIIEQTPTIPDNCQWALFLRNHDELTLEMVTDEERDFMYRRFAPELRMRVNLGIRRRLAPMLRGDHRKIRLLYGMLMSLPGTPIIYYGDEIGMGDNYHLGDRDGVRTPMQWSADRNAGFSRANPQSLFLPVITDPEYHYLSTNVETQEDNPASLLRWIQRLIAIRKQLPALSRGELEVVPCTSHRALAFVRRGQRPGEDVLVVMNLSRAARHIHLDLSDYVDTWPVEKWGRTQFPPVRQDEARQYPLSLGPHEFFWFQLSDEPLQRTPGAPTPRPAKPLKVREKWTEIFEGRLRPHFERHLWSYLDRQHWFNPQSRPIDSLETGERTRLRWEGGLTIICMVEVRFLDGNNELYVLPLEFSDHRRDGESRPRRSRSVVTQLQVESSDTTGVLYDATTRGAFASALLNFIRKEWKLDGLEGSMRGHWLSAFQDIEPDELDALSANLTELDHTHTTLIFGRRVVMKLFRRLDRGLSVDVEVGKHLLDQQFDGAAPLMAHLDYHRGRWEPTTLATVHRYVPHDTDGLTWYCEIAERQLEPYSISTAAVPHSPDLDGAALIECDPTEFLDDPRLNSFYADAFTLGQRTASLHHVLAAGDPETQFAPEPLTTAYERARYHWMRSLAARTFRLLRRRLSPEQSWWGLARWVLAHDQEIDQRFRALVGRGVGGLRIRIHGDYHLEELLRTDDDFVVIDFEGHPWLPLGQRRIKRSSLRDVASMMRSFHSASIETLMRRCDDYHIGDDDPRKMQLFHRAQALYAASCCAFLDGYLRDRDQLDFLPDHPEALVVLLDALRLKKAIRQLNNDLERGADPTIALMGVTTLLMIEE